MRRPFPGAGSIVVGIRELGLETRGLGLGRDPREAARLLGLARRLVDSGLVALIPFIEPLYEHTRSSVGELVRDELERLMAEGAEAADRGDVLKPDYLAALSAAERAAW